MSVEETRDLTCSPAEPAEAADLAAEEFVGDDPNFDWLEGALRSFHGRPIYNSPIAE
jgi:hypothetical protein